MTVIVTPIHQLVDQIQALERRSSGAGPSHDDDVRTGWAVDAAIGGFGRRVLHEWFVDAAPAEPDRSCRQRAAGRDWTAPTGIFMHLAKCAATARGARSGRLRVVWIGRRCWPHWTAEADALGGTILLDPPDEASRVWAVDLALRCPAIGAVVADASGFTMPVTRRLQLAAGQGGALGLLARPPWERKELSAAATRWRVEPVISDQDGPRWAVELLRCKGMQPTSHARRWVVELPCPGE